MINSSDNSENKQDIPNTVKASPSKRFFVEMLTRDIELQDAILDLLDNCVDGIVRTQDVNKLKSVPEKKYSGFWAKIQFDENKFVIQDNCGGIPKKILVEKAFKLGRGFNDPPSEHSTVGIYGIGMKRAIFKMGLDATVITHFKSKEIDEAFQVSITSDWMKSDDFSDLPLISVPTNEIEVGTKIEVTTLRENIKKSFSTKSLFINLLREEIATHFSRILEMGFEVYINGDPITPKPTKMLYEIEKGIAPFVFAGKHENVDVSLVVGLWRDFPSETEVEEEESGESGKDIKAGWTIICNDRVVVYRDRTILTGWGDEKVPSFHSQFNSIAGIVNFHSDQVEDLPLTTTKRGLDASSELYLQVKNVMRDGLKHFTQLTNKWKSPTPERKEVFGDAKLMEVSDVVQFVVRESAKISKGNKIKKSPVTVGQLWGEKFVPNLPKPKPETTDMKTISFKRKVKEIELLSNYIFGTSDVPPREVGEKCFEILLTQAR